MSSTSRDHAGDTPSTSASKVHGNKGEVKLPCRLWEWNNPIHCCPYRDEAQKVLDNHPASPQRLPYGYRRLSLKYSLVDKVTDLNQPSVKLSLPECQSHESISSQSEVEETIFLISPSINCSFPLESEYDTT